MRFCQRHWDALRAAVRARGLDHLVGKSGREALERARDELAGTATDATYDPLLAAHNMILGRALEGGGLYLLTGDYCPVCEAVAHKDDSPNGAALTVEQAESYWIDGPADAVLAYCREHGLAPPPPGGTM